MNSNILALLEIVETTPANERHDAVNDSDFRFALDTLSFQIYGSEASAEYTKQVYGPVLYERLKKCVDTYEPYRFA